MTKIVVLCETAIHIREALLRIPGSTVVALTPEAAWTCQQQEVPYSKLDDGYADSELNMLAELVTRSQYAWAGWVDSQLAAMVPEFGKVGFAPARQHLFVLKRRLDSFVIPAFALMRFVDAFEPETLIAFERPPFLPDLIPSAPERPLHALLAPALGFQGCKVEIWPQLDRENDRSSASAIDVQDSIKNWVRRYMTTVRGALMAGVRRWRQSLSEATYRCRSLAWSPVARVAWIGGKGDFVWVAPRLADRCVTIIRRMDIEGVGRGFEPQVRQAEAQLREAWQALRVAPEFWTFLDKQSLGLRSVAEPFLREWVTKEIARAWGSFLEARQWLSRQRIDLVMAPAVVGGALSSVFSAAAALGVPRLVYLHNPPGGPIDLPAQDCQDQIQADYYLVGGVGDVAYFRSFDARYGTFPRAQPIAVGSARLDAVRLTCSKGSAPKVRRDLMNDPGQPLILYVPTGLVGPYRYFNEGSFSDVAYFELLQRMLSVFRGFPVTVLYKPFPRDWAWNPIGDFVTRYVPNVRVMSNRMSLEELMRAVDAIVVDFPSTAIAEVLLTDKPVLCFAGREWARMFPDARQALAKRAQVSETAAEFESQLREFLRRGCYAPLLHPDDEFLRLHATHLNDGHSAERAAEVITQIVSSRRAHRASLQVPVGATQ